MLGASLVAAYLAVTERGTGGRHVADVEIVRRPPAPLEVRAAVLPSRRDLRDVPATVPTVRPCTGGIPVLVVDGPPGARGQMPATDLPEGVIVERRAHCSLCQDGAVPAPTRSGGCAWCGLVPR